MSEYWSFLRARRWYSLSANFSLVRLGAYPCSLRVGIGLVTAILIGLGSPAHSQFFWQDDYPDVYIGEPPPPPITRSRAHEFKPRRLPKPEPTAKVTRKPNGPIIIAVSIRRQTMKVYDGNGLFAESPVSTGMRGHSTPMGVFSVIQKRKWHRSNIYSNAPMPYMQRITWSGVAMHAGALPGYPASHGCIRMPLDFAVKMWNWTRIGARVIITPGEVTPADFSHPLLAIRRPEPASAPAEMKASDASDTMPPVEVSSLASDLPAAGEPATATSKAAAEPIRTASGNAQDADMTVTAAVKTDGDTASSPAGTPAMPEDQSQSPPASAEKTGLMAISTLKRSDRIAVFISGKDSKIYVRQNFSPIFDAPITIATSNRPLGTHVYTAEAAKGSKDDFRWSVVSLPALAQRADRAHGRKSRSGQQTNVGDATARPVPGSATDALDRISLPEDVMAKIAYALSTGDSIVISDQGIAGSGETGEGTDFIVKLP